MNYTNLIILPMMGECFSPKGKELLQKGSIAEMLRLLSDEIVSLGDFILLYIPLNHALNTPTFSLLIMTASCAEGCKCTSRRLP